MTSTATAPETLLAACKTAAEASAVLDHLIIEGFISLAADIAAAGQVVYSYTDRGHIAPKSAVDKLKGLRAHAMDVYSILSDDLRPAALLALYLGTVPGATPDDADYLELADAAGHIPVTRPAMNRAARRAMRY